MYKAVDMVTEEPGTATLTFKGESGAEKTLTVQTVSGPAVWQGMHNTEKSIRAFARSCFQYAISQRQDLWFSTKDTISKVYDGEFKRIGGVREAGPHLLLHPDRRRGGSGHPVQGRLHLGAEEL